MLSPTGLCSLRKMWISLPIRVRVRVKVRVRFGEEETIQAFQLNHNR